jgi:uncharacterized 2Fe-2S/4Fe-4S cluster protein (DUF4445 family)
LGKVNAAALVGVKKIFFLFRNSVIIFFMITIKVKTSSGSEGVFVYDADSGDDLLSALQKNAVYIAALCGRRGKCGKCKVRVTAGALAPSPFDKGFFSREELDEGWRLSCGAIPEEDISVFAPFADEKKFEALDSFDINTILKSIDLQNKDLENKDLKNKDLKNKDLQNLVGHGIDTENYGIAIDIGTTTLALMLIDINKRIVLDRVSFVNKQREFGADVISRIEKANSGRLKALSDSIRAQLRDGIITLCKKNSTYGDNLSCIAIAGNTTMLHLFWELSCEGLGVFPFTPVTIDITSKNIRDVWNINEVHISENCRVKTLPGISTYVGADIVAGIYFCEMHRDDKPSVLIDIGTNGEMALAVGGEIFVAATAAGPAFEGGNMRSGTGSVPGAIRSVRYADGGFEIETIDNIAPLGICGTGVIELVDECLKNELIEESGHFSPEVKTGELVLAKNADGADIVFTQKDVRELQLAKSAIRSGLESLLHATNLRSGDIGALYIAGGFGNKLNFSSGAGIGLIPRELEAKVKVIGNSSLGGAVKYIMSGERDAQPESIVKICREYNLGGDPFFNEAFIDNIEFD